MTEGRGPIRPAPAVTLADPREDGSLLPWLRQAYAFYLHDLSQYDGSGYKLSGSGQWEPDYLPYWLEQPFCHPLVLLSDREPRGFAFVGETPFPYMTAGTRFRLAEFFVLRSLRRCGFGSAAALAVFSRFAGAFELMVLESNAPALAFWRGVLPRATSGPVHEFPEEQAVRFAFTTAAAAS